MKKFDYIKVAYFVAEEVGCAGGKVGKGAVNENGEVRSLPVGFGASAELCQSC